MFGNFDKFEIEPIRLGLFEIKLFQLEFIQADCLVRCVVCWIQSKRKNCFISMGNLKNSASSFLYKNK